ncbi:MAG: hypothetical protein KAJ73_04885, partial [Zetaproteobacteria bacterium]|nr:hypothetical protein [Zetaproteobacteria bacterium]
NGIFISPLSAFNISDVIGIALDVDNSEVTFYKNNVVLGNGAYKILKVSPNYYFYIHARINNGTSDMTTRYDSSYWAYTAPLGFVELNSNNLENINGLGKPDLVWIKNRDQADSHTLFDSSRGIGKYLESDTTDSEATDVNSLQQFNKGGFYLGSSIATNTVNESYVAWVWKKGVTPGFDVVEYTGNGTSQNIDHNLGVIPEMYIVKNVNGTTTNWGVYHETIGADYYLVLDGSNAKINSLVAWNNTLPTATQFSVGGGHTSVSTDYIAYLFSEIEGYSKIGKYIGNGSTDGPFIHCGFRPAFLLIKSSIGAAGHWIIYDNVRDDNNDNIPSKLVPSTNGAESVTLTNYLDMLSNGFKIRSSSDTINLNAVTFIYMAFAESPFKYSRAR